MAKESRIFFISGEGGRLIKRIGVDRNRETGNYIFRFRPINSVRTKEVAGIPPFLVMHVNRETTPNAPPEGCYIVFTDTSGDKMGTTKMIDWFQKQLENTNTRASLAEGQAAKTAAELEKLKTATHMAIERDMDFAHSIERTGKPRRGPFEGLGPKKTRNVMSPDEYEDYTGEE